MRDWPKRWIRGASTIVVFCLAVLGGVVVRSGSPRWSWPSDNAASPPNLTLLADLDVGEKLCVPRVNFERAGRTIVTVLTETCHACTESSSFIKKLLDSASGFSIPVYIIVPQDFKGTLLDGLSLSPEHIIRVDLSTVGLGRVPAFVAVNRDGTMCVVQAGAVPEPEEGALIETLLRGEMKPLAKKLPRDMLGAYLQEHPDAQLVDVRSRSKLKQTNRFQGLSYIPYDELYMRAPYELDSRRPVVLDCGSVQEFFCSDALTSLRLHNFNDVNALAFQGRAQSGACTVAGGQ